MNDRTIQPVTVTSRISGENLVKTRTAEKKKKEEKAVKE
jgi:hypothetical protein